MTVSCSPRATNTRVPSRRPGSSWNPRIERQGAAQHGDPGHASRLVKEDAAGEGRSPAEADQVDPAPAWSSHPEPVPEPDDRVRDSTRQPGGRCRGCRTRRTRFPRGSGRGGRRTPVRAVGAGPTGSWRARANHAHAATPPAAQSNSARRTSRQQAQETPAALAPPSHHLALASPRQAL